MDTKTNIQFAAQQSTYSTNSGNSNVTATSAPPRVDPSTQITIPNTPLPTREINPTVSEYAAMYPIQTQQSIQQAIHDLPTDVTQFQENQVVAKDPAGLAWEIIYRLNHLFLIFMIMKSTIMMPVYKDQ